MELLAELGIIKRALTLQQVQGEREEKNYPEK